MPHSRGGVAFSIEAKEARSRERAWWKVGWSAEERISEVIRVERVERWSGRSGKRGGWFVLGGGRGSVLRAAFGVSVLSVGRRRRLTADPHHCP
jgi:hypothetical protein